MSLDNWSTVWYYGTVGTPITWSLYNDPYFSSGPFHGTVVASYSTSSNGGLVAPAGFSYTPNPGYFGVDQFFLIATDGYNNALTHFDIAIYPDNAGTITGPSVVYIGSEIVLSDTVNSYYYYDDPLLSGISGTWSVSNGNAELSSLFIHPPVFGMRPGLDTISYTVSSTCGTYTSTKVVTVMPTPIFFTVGSPQYLEACENSGPKSIDTLLQITDPNPGEEDTWSIYHTPTNGTLVAAYTATSSGDQLIPAGLTYTPNPGYIGLDSFEVQATNGTQTIYKWIAVHVHTTSAGTITGASTVSAGNKIVLEDAVDNWIYLNDPTSGGTETWSASNGHAAVSDSTYYYGIAGTFTYGVVTGISAGVDVITCSLHNICGTYTATKPVNVVASTSLYFIGGTTQTRSICENSGSISIDTSLAVSDIAAGDAITWSVYSGPANGALIASYSANSDGDLLIPEGLTYTPDIGYSGTEEFTVQATNGSVIVYTTIHLTINPLSAVPPIVGSNKVCVGATDILTDGAAGGIWSADNGNVSITTGGAVTGVSTGSTTISYTLTTGCTATLSLSINGLPPVHSIMGSGSYCGAATIGLNGSEIGINCQLYYSGTPIGSAAAGTGAALAFSGLIASGTYTAIATNIVTGCTTNMAGSATITVNPTPPICKITGGGTYCAGGAGVHLGLSCSALGVNYRLFRGTTLVGALAGTGSALDFGLQSTPGIYKAVAIYASGGCAVNMNDSVRVNIDSPPAIYTVTGGGSYCSGGTGVHIGLSGSASGITYHLYRGTTAVGVPLAGTGTVLAFGLETIPGTYKVVATKISSGCINNMADSALVIIDSLPVVYAATGGGSYCSGGAGVHIGLSGSAPGINYHLYRGTTAVGTPLAGMGSTLDFGAETVAGTYKILASNITTGCTSNMSGIVLVSINPLPAIYPITGGGNYCEGGTGVHIGMSNSQLAVSYQLYNGTAAYGPPIAGAGGVLDFGLKTSAGNYKASGINVVTGCISNMADSATVVISPLITPSVHISASPATNVCTGTLVSFTATPAGGGAAPVYSWTINGIVTGSTGIMYSYIPFNDDKVTVALTTSATCPLVTTARDSVTMSVALPAVSASASQALCGGSYTLGASGGVSYSWTPDTWLSCSNCPAPEANPLATITYTVTGTTPGGCSDTASVTVNGNRVSGYISPYIPVSIKVWLIQFNPIDSSLTALDSTTACTSGALSYYEFDNPVNGNYTVKAYLPTSTPGESGYVPTYGLSSLHWNMADTVVHMGATDTMHINMIYGEEPVGSGFISGYIGSGAGKGTSGLSPVPGMLVYILDPAGSVLTFTYTDSSGNYSFGHLVNGNYIVYPEFYQYFTTPTSALTISDSIKTITNVDFKQHTSSRTIAPLNNTSVKSVYSNAVFTIYPNPSNGRFKIISTVRDNESSLEIYNTLGKRIYHTTLAQAKEQTIDVGTQPGGVYTYRVIAGNGELADYGKIIIQK